MDEQKTNTPAQAKPVEEKKDVPKEIPVDEMSIVSPVEWRKKNYNIRKIQLPSGMVIKVKDVELSNMAMSGVLSLPLLTSFLDLQTRFRGIAPEKLKDNTVLKDFKDSDLIILNEIANRICVKASIEPEFTLEETGDENTIPITEIEITDKMFIFNSCIRGGAEAFASFLGTG